MSTPSTEQRSVFRRKPVEAFVTETAPDAQGGELSRSIGLFQLTMLGVGGTIGTGIFIVLTEAVPEAGPAVIVSFGVAACLLLEYGVSAAAVSVGWGQYLNELLFDLFAFRIPGAINAAPGEGGLFNLPAIVLVTLCGLLLIRGVRESATANTIMVLIKLAVLALFIVVGFTAFSAENLEPFAPFGLAGIGAAAGSIFFSFIGLDAVSTAGEEVHNPRRNLPLAILFATIIVTTFYILVALAGVGAQPYQQFAGQEAGLSVIMRNITGSGWPAAVLAAGATISLT